MVGTRRKSGEVASSPPPSDEASIADKRTKLALKKLNIDAHDALIGDRTLTEDSEVKEVYHYRGAVYECAPGTKPEWVDSQPKRWKRKSEAEVAEEAKAEKQRAVEKKTQLAKAGTKRKRSEAEAEETNTSVKKARNTPHEKKVTVREARAKQARTAKKAEVVKARANKITTEVREKKPIRQLAGEKRLRNPVPGNQEDTSQPSAKRAKRNLEAKYYGRPKRTPTSTPRKRKPRKPSAAQPDEEDEETAINSSITYDFATVGGHEEVSCMEAARGRARAQGYMVDPIGTEEMRMMAERQTLRQLMELMEYNRKIEDLKKRIGDEGQRLKEARAESRASAETEGGQEEEDWPRKRKRVDSAGVLENETAGPTEEEQAMPMEGTATPLPEARHVERTQALTPTSNTSAAASQLLSEESDDEDVEIITSHPPTPASSYTPPTSTSPPSTAPAPLTAPALTAPTTFVPTGPAPLPTHETTNKNGNKERWSLPANMTADDRAEAHIYRGRFAGESRQARRRRIKREMDRIGTWEKVEEGMIHGVSAGVESGGEAE